MQNFNNDDVSMMNNDMGLDLLINSKKKQINDKSSQSSRSSLRDKDLLSNYSSDNDNPESIKSININIDSEKSDNNTEESSISEKQKYNSSAGEENYRSQRNNFNESSFSDEDIINKKKDLLYEFARMEKRNVNLPRKFTMASSLDEMQQEYDRLKRDREIDASVKFQRRMMLAFVSGVEFMNDRFDPFDVHLTGWSETVNDDIEDYDEIFEELHEKYRGKSHLAPELRLLMALGGSGFMFHVQNSLKSSIPGLDEVLKNNPELRRQVAKATAAQMSQESKNSQNNGGMMNGMANFMTGFFGNNKQENDNYQEPITQDTRDGGPMNKSGIPQNTKNVRMSGPENVEDLLAELDLDTSRVELLSEISQSSIPDDASISGLLATDSLKNKKTKKKKKNTVNI